MTYQQWQGSAVNKVAQEYFKQLINDFRKCHLDHWSIFKWSLFPSTDFLGYCLWKRYNRQENMQAQCLLYVKKITNLVSTFIKKRPVIFCGHFFSQFTRLFLTTKTTRVGYEVLKIHALTSWNAFETCDMPHIFIFHMIRCGFEIYRFFQIGSWNWRKENDL